MPFDTHDFAGVAPGASTPERRNRRLVAGWLFGVCFMIFVMVVLGGTTRLTGSGLSIMEWSPFAGALPPMSHAEWMRLYHLYEKIPQYALVNQGFGLSGFKHIFWLEWTHRVWGRLIGAAFLLPLIWLASTHRIPRRLIPRLVVLFLLGGLQGAVGWFMVASGFFPDSTAVAPLRLVVHLSLALILYGAILWTALSVLHPVARPLPGARGVRTLAGLTLGLVCITIVAGGFTAGTHAGYEYNTFPLMAGRLVPAGYAKLHPFLRNLVQNIAAVQFDHRLLATLTALAVLATAFAGRKLRHAARNALLVMVAAVVLQYALGIATLLSVVAIPLATAHQASAVLLLTATIVGLHNLRGAHAARRATGPGSSHVLARQESI